MGQKRKESAKASAAGQTKPRAATRADPGEVPTRPDASAPDPSVVWVRISPSQVVRAVAVGLLTAVVLLGALYLLWRVRAFVGWFVIALFLTAVLGPPVKWLERRHRLIKRPLAILTWSTRT